jgi:hypothetical protein
VELRLGVYSGEEKVSTIPAREGETLTLNRNRLILVKLLPWRHVSTGGGVGDTIRLGRPAGNGGRPVSGPDSFTTAVFYCLEPQALEIHAILDSGETAERGMFTSTEGWLCCRFNADVDRIREFRVLEERDVFEVVFHLPEIRGLPPENEGVTNRLDIRYPHVEVELYDAFSGIDEAEVNLQIFLRTVLRSRFDSEEKTTHYGSGDPDAPPAEYENTTVRELLDIYFPHRWWVASGRVHITRDRFGPIVWKVKEAWKEICGEGSR